MNKIKSNRTNFSLPTNLIPWLVLGILGLTWGSSYILIKKGLVAFSPYQVGCIRISIAAISFIPILLNQWSRIDWKKWKLLILVGFLGSFFPAFLFPIAQTELSSSITGVLSSLTPLSTLIIGALFFSMKVRWIKVLGVILGLIGAALLLLLGKMENNLDGNIFYGGFAILATICYSIVNNLVKRHLQDMSTFSISAVSFSIIGIPALIYLFNTDFLTILQEHPQGLKSFGFIIILSIVGTVIATLLYFKLVLISNPVFAATVNYLIPIVAIFWGLFDGETIHTHHFFCMGLILLGVYIARK